MDSVQNYQCPCCGAPLFFHAEFKQLHCNSCENSFPLDTMEQLSDAQQHSQETSKYDWEHYEPRSFENTNDLTLSDYSCPSCGAEIMGDDTAGASVCPYCGNSTIIKSQFEGTLKPDYIIPFKVNKKAAMEAFEEDFKKAPFLPDSFRDKKKIEEMVGMYVPFWMFDCDCHASLTYNAQKTICWSDSNYNYTKTDYFKLFRNGSIGFANIPVDGSKKADDTFMEAIEPYHYDDAVIFDSGYLSGFLADKYDVSPEDSIKRANERVKNSTEAAFSHTTNHYQAVIPEHSNINFSNGKIRYSLLPVWMLNIKYADQIYHFAINGQTGKVVGKYPVDKRKKWNYFAKVAGIAYAAAAVIAFFLLH